MADERCPVCGKKIKAGDGMCARCAGGAAGPRSSFEGDWGKIGLGLVMIVAGVALSLGLSGSDNVHVFYGLVLVGLGFVARGVYR